MGTSRASVRSRRAKRLRATGLFVVAFLLSAVAVFAPTTPDALAQGDGADPVAAILMPEAGETLTENVVFSGTATDNSGIRAVEVGFKNPATGDWLQPDGSIAGAREYLPANLSSPNARSTNWTIAVTLPEGDWVGQVRAEDIARTRASDRPSVRFQVGGGAVDSQAPNSKIDSPSAGDEVAGPTVRIAGSSTDNVGTTDVLITVRNTDSGKWLRANGSFGAWSLLETSLSRPGASSTDWSLTADLPAANYVVQARAVDGAGNVESSRPRAVFSVVVANDTVAPDSVITRPTTAQNVSGPDVTFRGTTTDSVGVTRVGLTVKNVNTGQWLRADGSLGGFALLNANLGNPGGRSTGWSLSADVPAGDYVVQARGFDEAGNEETSRPRVVFEVSNPAGNGGDSTQDFVGNAVLFHFVPVSVSKYTREEAMEVAENHDLLVAHERTFKWFIPSMKRANPDVTILLYQKGSTVEDDLGNAYPSSWYLRDASGDKVRSVPWGSYLMDIENPAYRQEVVDQCVAQHRAASYDGCYFDVMGLGALFIAGSAPVSSPGGPEITKSEWHVMEREFTEWLSANLPGSTARMSNGLGAGRLYFNPEYPSSELSEAMGSNHSEIWHRAAYDPATKFRTLNDFRDDLNLLVDAGSKGNEVLVTTKVWSSHTAAQADQWRDFSYASFLLGTDGSHYFAFTSEDNAIEGPEAIYSMNIGVAQGDHDERANGIFVRSYTDGFVIVNAGTGARNVTLPNGSFVDQDGIVYSGTANVGSHRGLVLRAR